MFSIFGNPFIHPAAYEPEPQPSLAPLFRLLSDFDNYHAEAPQQCQRRTAPEARRSAFNMPRAALTRTTTFTPKFDVRETATTYELHGEFPGLQRENVQIEFVEPQTLAIRGRVERRYETKPEEPAAAAPEEPAAQPAESEAAAAPADEVEVDWEDVRSEASSSSSTRSNYHRPTVEDDAEDEDAQSVVSTPRTVASEASKPVTPTPAPEKAAAKKAEKPAPAPAPVKAAANGRFWLVEREVGEFSRTFSFAERVDQDKVQATLENGILTVSVPKAARHVVRRVVIF